MNYLCNLLHIFVNNVFSDFHVNEAHCVGLSASFPLNNDNEL